MLLRLCGHRPTVVSTTRRPPEEGQRSPGFRRSTERGSCQITEQESKEQPGDLGVRVDGDDEKLGNRARLTNELT